MRLAQEATERALALNPNLAQAHIQLGRFDEALQLGRRAAGFDPLNGNSRETLGAGCFSWGSWMKPQRTLEPECRWG
jgi:Flp pilus assembly protein TadD